MVKMSSNGAIIYKQERIGLNGKPFKIYKFRSMYENAEKDGPQLSSKKDNRVTPWGKFMRRTRLDETPQFFNILKGDMSFRWTKTRATILCRTTNYKSTPLQTFV